MFVEVSQRELLLILALLIICLRVICGELIFVASFALGPSDFDKTSLGLLMIGVIIVMLWDGHDSALFNGLMLQCLVKLPCRVLFQGVVRGLIIGRINVGVLESWLSESLCLAMHMLRLQKLWLVDDVIRVQVLSLLFILFGKPTLSHLNILMFLLLFRHSLRVQGGVVSDLISLTVYFKRLILLAWIQIAKIVFAIVAILPAWMLGFFWTHCSMRLDRWASVFRGKSLSLKICALNVCLLGKRSPLS